jgi:aminodeoxyfutalosine deaminase
VDSGRVLENAGLLVHRGRVVDLVRSTRRAARRVRLWVEVGDGAIVPGLVNAHAHLELTGLAGRVPAGAGFIGWVRGLVDLRRDEQPSELRRAARRGADLLLASGCTAVGDIDSTGAGAAALARHPMRSVVYREVLDLGDPARRRAALAAAERRPRLRRRFMAGISPHAPYTTSSELLVAVRRSTARTRAPLAIHWAETVEEGDWLEQGSGPFGELLGPGQLLPGLDRIEAAGLLSPRLALVHGNDPRRDEPQRIAAAGASVVHCPGSHAFFGRPPFPLQAFTKAGVTLALGTDSLASNGALDMRREMALVRRSFPDLDPRHIWHLATEGSARALGLGGRIGALRPRMQADLVACSTSAGGVGELWDQLTGGGAEIRGVWIGGRPVVGAGGAAPGAPGAAGR